MKRELFCEDILIFEIVKIKSVDTIETKHLTLEEMRFAANIINESQFLFPI